MADLRCGKDGKLRGDVELMFLGNEESQAELDEASCEDLKELKKELKQVKFAIGYVDENDEFQPVVYSKKYEAEDANCDGYTDLVYEFSLKKLVCAGIFDESTEQLAVGLYVKQDCEWVLEESGTVDVKINYDCDDDCEESKDCDSEKDCDYEKSCDNESNYDNQSSCEKKKSCDKDSDGESSTKDCDKSKKKKKDCDSNEQPT
ncbi:MAG TPA: hypothetical protein VFY93_13810 [Planctomycetota bacterium]|nr:hypothetical protein [Planctomycetota bacterium]